MDIQTLECQFVMCCLLKVRALNIIGSNVGNCVRMVVINVL